MLKIGRSYLERTGSATRLCANVSANGRGTTLWFAVDSVHESWLTLGRADAFVVALLPEAMWAGHEICCEDPMSERLHYQLVNGLIPTLTFAGNLYHLIKITAPLTTEKISNQGAVGTGFSGGVDCLYTIMRHGPDSELPLSHIATFNTGSPYREKSTLDRIFQRAKMFGAEQKLIPFFVDTNFKETLSDFRYGTYTYRNLACALALQGLFKTYLLSSGPNASKLNLDLSICARYDLLTVSLTSTESLSFYLSGVETTRGGKLTALTEWEPSRRWLNPCALMEGKPCNCGRCKKCIHDMTMLYALGQLEKYTAVFDMKDYLRHLPARIGYVLANRDDSESCAQAAWLLEKRGIPIPPAARLYERQFRRIKQRQQEHAPEEGSLSES